MGDTAALRQPIQRECHIVKGHVDVSIPRSTPRLSTEAKPALFAQMRRLGRHQSVPFALTVAGILATDLLIGIGLGVVAAAGFILVTNYRYPYFVEHASEQPGQPIRLRLSEDVSFLNRASIKRTLDHLPAGTCLEIDASRTVSLDHDVYEMIKEFQESAPNRGIEVRVRDLSALHQDNGSMRRDLTPEAPLTRAGMVESYRTTA